MNYDHAFGTEVTQYTVSICDDYVCTDVGEDMEWNIEEAIYQARIYPKGTDAWVRAKGENVPFMHINKVTGDHVVCLPTVRVFL